MPRPPRLLFAGVALAGALVPALLAPPVPGFGDGSELMLVLAQGGVAHPTGYPLWTILGHGFVVLLHALGLGWARAAAAWSAAGAACALWFLQLLAWEWAGARVRTPRFAAAACALSALALAFDPIWLEQAATAEVYTWHVAWACAAAWCALGPAARTTARAAALLGFVLGLGLAHHGSAIFVAAPLAGAWAADAWRRQGARAALAGAGVAALAALVPLSTYGWIAWRAFHPGPAQWPVLGPSWRLVWDHLAGAQYRDLLGRFAPDPHAAALLARFGWPVLVPGLVALVALAVAGGRGERRTWSVAAVAAGALVATGWTLLYGVPDPEAYVLMPCALGLAALGAAAARAGRAIVPRPALATLVNAACALGLVAWAATGVRSSLATRADTIESDQLVRLMWLSLPADSSLVFWPGDPYERLLAYQQLDGEKRSLSVMNPAFLGFPAVRQRFAARFGFDPMQDFRFTPLRAGSAGESLAIQLLYRELLLHVSARTPRPVYVMIPEQGILRLVPKGRDPSGPPPTVPPGRAP